MERLTGKWKDDYTPDLSTTQQCLNKLGKLEDLEEQLGCPLEVLGKALRVGIYTKKLPSGDRIKHSGLKLSSTEKGYYLFNETMCVDVRDYKVLFWLKEDKSE